MKYIKICFTCFFFYLPVAPGEYADIPLEGTSTVSPVVECHTSSALCHFSLQAQPHGGLLPLSVASSRP